MTAILSGTGAISIFSFATRNRGPTTARKHASGDFDVLYGIQGKNGTLTDTVQRYTAAGAANGKPISIASGGTPASIAMDAAGDFAVAWSGSSSVIDAERFSSAGKSTTGIIQVDQPATGNLVYQADVGMDLAGDFVVTWLDQAASSGGGSRHDVGLYARVFYANGTSTAPIEEVTPNVVYDSAKNAYYVTNGVWFVDPPAVVMQPNGGGAFDLVWTGYNDVADSSGTFVGFDWGIYAQPFSSAGIATQGVITAYQSHEYLYSGTNESLYLVGFPSAAIDANNDLLAVYTIGSQDTPPAGGAGDVFVQFYPDPPAPSATTASSAISSPSIADSSIAAPAAAAAIDAAMAAYDDEDLDDDM